jgi:hypothetical protein
MAVSGSADRDGVLTRVECHSVRVHEEGGSMAQTVADLAACLAAAKNQGERNKCEREFKAGGGKEDGGKVFSDSAGGQIATTQDGGKVFSPKR